MILTNEILNNEGLIGDSHLLPACFIGYNEGDIIKDYISSLANPTTLIDFKGVVLIIRLTLILASF